MLSKLFTRGMMYNRTPMLIQPRMSIMSQNMRMFGAFANHRNTEDNLEESPFEFTEESYKAIEVLLKKFPDNYKSSAIIPVLFIAQK